MVTPDVKRNAVAHVCAQHGVSQRRACQVLSFDRSSMRYRSVRPDDAAIREAMKKLASERRRFGYRRIHVMLDRQGIVMNLKKLRRLYREEKLTVRKRGGRKRALGTRRPLALPSRPNERWSLDFISDAFTDGRRSVFWRWSTTLHANAFVWSPTHACRGHDFLASWIVSSPDAETRGRSSRTMGRR